MLLPSVQKKASAISEETEIDAKSYFRLKEQFFYYKLINSAPRKRSYSQMFIAEVSEFLARYDTEGVYRLFVQPSQTTDHGAGSYKLLCKIHPIIGAHFAPEDLTDISKAKSAYRKAASKVHPDMGGGHEEMTALNVAFNAVFDHLMLASFGDSESGISSGYDSTSLHRNGSFARGRVQPGFWPGSILQYPQSGQEFELLLRTELLIAAKDLFQEDLFAEHAAHLPFNERWRAGKDGGDAFSRGSACESVAELIISCREASFEEGRDDLSAQLKPLAEDWVAGAIAAWTESGRQEQRAFGKQAITEADKNDPEGLPYIDEWRAKNLLDLRRRITEPKSRAETRFQLMHLLQAENARRRGLITEKRYQDALKRFDIQDIAIDEAAKKVVAIFHGSGFMPLEHDPAPLDQAAAELINESNPEEAFGKWQLADDQSRAAYLRAFYEDAALDGKMVYVRQRLWITLSSLIGSESSKWDDARVSRAAQEVSALGEAAKASREGQASDHAEELAEFLQFLADESDQNRRKRLELLGKVVVEDVRTMMLQDIFPLGSNAKNAVWTGEREWSPLTRVIPSASYFEAAKRPLEDLEIYAVKGSWPDGDALSKRQHGLEYYSKHMNRLSNKMFNASSIDDPRKRTDKLAPLVRQALDQDVPKEAAGEWQIQHYIDRLTAALTRCRHFQTAHDLLTEYFALDPAYRERSTRSGDEVLSKRLARCQRELAN